MKQHSLKLQDGKYQCTLCHHRCLLSFGEKGKCTVREATEDGVSLIAYAQLTAVMVEPIEKKPIYHFKPNAKTLSLGGFGCSFNCSFCQNHEISQQNKEYKLMQFSPSAVINTALEKKCSCVCMTFNEPTIYYEYLIDIADKAHKNGLSFAIKTNAFLEPGPWEDICEVVDAMNIDYKGDDKRLQSITSVSPGSALHIASNISYAISRKHMEISIPVFSDSEIDEFSFIRNLLSELDKDIPVHLVKIFPCNRYVEQATPDDLIMFVMRYMREKMNFVYAENIFTGEGRESRSTVCPSCGQVVASRHALQVDISLNPGCETCKQIFVL